MTTPTDAIAGLSERLRISLAGVAREETGGDNLAILLASYFEPSIEDEELDDSGTWKQGAIDACNKVLDAIHGHYATAIDALRNEINDWANEVARYKAYAEKFDQENAALQARVKELEAERKRYDAEVRSWKIEHDQKLATLRRQTTRLQQERDDLNEDVLEWAANAGQMTAAFEKERKRAEKAEQERDEAYERAAKVALAQIQKPGLSDNPSYIHFQPSDMMARKIAAAIRRIAGPEKEGK